MIEVIAAPSPLGLRPPEPTAVPGTAKAPEALREVGLYERLGAKDGGTVLPGRYRDDWRPGEDRLRNEEELIAHARRLSARIATALDAGRFPLVLGGDCSLLLAAGLAVAGREVGLVHVDGHTDFRHPGNSDVCSSLGGEDLAAATGLHWPHVGDIDGLGPYFPPGRAVHLGCREDDEHLSEAREHLALLRSAADIAGDGPRATADAVGAALGPVERFWLHVDIDVLDPAEMPAVDSPAPGGLTSGRLTELLRELARGRSARR